MSDFITNLKTFITDLFTPGPQVMNYWKLYNKLTYWKTNHIYPNTYEIPDVISLPQNFWDDVISIYRETDRDGYERAISVFWADGELVVTSSVKGSTTSVNAGGKVSVRYSPSSRPEYATKEVIIDNVVKSREQVYYKKIPSKILVEFLLSLHTHPPHDKEKWSNNDQTKIQQNSFQNIYIPNRKYYSFFSKQDIVSLFSSNSPVTGLVTDRLYLVFRTNSSVNLLDSMSDGDISLETLKDKLKLEVFHGEFRQKLIHITNEKSPN